MSELTWDQVGEKTYETGVDHGVLYIPDSGGAYINGYAWNGLVSVTESPTGAEANKQYADNIMYLSLVSAEIFGATVEAFTYPDQFGQCDGTAEPVAGVKVGQQIRKSFGMSYRTKLGNDLDAEAGFLLHLVYNALAAPSEKAYSTVNDSPEAITFSWELTTTPVPVTGLKPTSILTINSTKVGSTQLAALEDMLYGTIGADPFLPTPDAVIALLDGAVTLVETAPPTYNSTTDIVTIPSITGVEYYQNGILVTGTFGPITEDTVFTALPAAGYGFTPASDSDWTINFA